MNRVVTRSSPWLAALLASCALFGGGAEGGPAPVALRCEYLVDPLGVDVRAPRLSWQSPDTTRGARQTAWQVLVATDPERLAPGEADVWDSGKVKGDDSVAVAWGGPQTLAGATRYHWTVRVWNGADLATDFAAPASFETGVPHVDDWHASWIGDGTEAPSRDEDFHRDRPAPLFRKPFSLVGEPQRARLWISGLGFHEARLNGERVGDARLEPAWTKYDRVVPYVVHDVTSMLHDGENVLGVMLGSGWYDPLPLRLWGRLDLRKTLPVGQPKLFCRLDVVQEDGSRLAIVSDRSWRTAPGPIVRNNVYLGESYDARVEPDGWDSAAFDDRAWRRVAVVDGPGGTLQCLGIPPVRAGTPLRPTKITSPRSGLHVVDFGQNFAGVVRLTIDQPPGTVLGLRYGEELLDDGTVDVRSTVAAQIKGPGIGGPGAPDVAAQEDRYVCRGGGRETFEPRFTWHGFRFVEIAGLENAPDDDDILGVPLHADLERVSSFACSDELLNRIARVVDWTLLSNAMSVLSDCPARERFGYGGDMVASAAAYQASFDMARLHRKAIEDFARDQRPSGGMSECAPDIGVNESGLTDDTGPLGWMLAHPWLLHRCWLEYGDRALVEEQYAALVRLLKFCNERLPEHVAVQCYGDHGCIGFNPAPLMATAAWYRIVTITIELANALGRSDDVREFEAIAARTREAFAKWMQPGSGDVFVKTQSGQATALHAGLVPPDARDRVLGALLDDIQQKQGRLSTGMFSTEHMFEVLSDAGRDDVVLGMVTSREYPGYGFMLDQGATTLWEHWSKKDDWSRNHPMYATVTAWMQRSILGIRQANGPVAWREIVVKPSVVRDMTWAKGHRDTVHGRIEVSWKRDGGRLALDVTIPANTRGVVHVPTLGRADATITESGDVLVENGRVAPRSRDAMIEVVELGPRGCAVRVVAGSYRFELR